MGEHDWSFYNDDKNDDDNDDDDDINNRQFMINY